MSARIEWEYRKTVLPLKKNMGYQELPFCVLSACARTSIRLLHYFQNSRQSASGLSSLNIVTSPVRMLFCAQHGKSNQNSSQVRRNAW